MLRVLLYCICISAFTPREAFAYIDPGAGSYIFQVLIAAGLGAAFTIRSFWRNIVDYIKGIFHN